MTNNILTPAACYVFYMWILALHNFKTRVGAVKSGQVHPRYYKAHLGESPPERVVLVGRHYDNQFQLPILFFVTCAIHFQIAKVNDLTLILAWLFVASRFAHSWIMLGRNHVLKRVAAFAFGWLMVVGLWFQILYFAQIQ